MKQVESMPPLESDSPGVRLPPPVVFAAGLALGLCVSAWIPTRWLDPVVSRTLGWLLTGAWFALTAWAFSTFRRAGTTVRPDRPATRLATFGPYSVTRNPMYVSLTLLYAGVAILWQSFWALLLLPVVLIFIDRRVIGREELYLERRFGADYTRYKAQVRRWL